MKTELLDYELPDELVAQRPPERRDGARLMVLGPSGIEHRWIAEWPELVPEGALVVVNDTRVLRARLQGRRRGSGGSVEIFLLRKLGGEGAEEHWTALSKANRPVRLGAIVDLPGLEIHVRERGESGTLEVILRTTDGRPVEEAVAAAGRTPLPPYIRRDDDDMDAERYQTIFAHESGSVAAPTAGLHLTNEAFARLRARGVTIGRVTLHVGLGTFRPVVTEDLDQHSMHAEEFAVSPELAGLVREARARGGKIVAVGTTVVRALESAADPESPGLARTVSGTTRLLIQPSYRFSVVDALLTNFHMPKSTLLSLVGAFAGLDRVLEAYRQAVLSKYRFLSYGDAMWLPERAH